MSNQKEAGLSCNCHATTVAMATPCQAGWYCDMQGWILHELLIPFSHSSLHSTLSTTQAGQQGVFCSAEAQQQDLVEPCGQWSIMVISCGVLGASLTTNW